MDTIQKTDLQIANEILSAMRPNIAPSDIYSAPTSYKTCESYLNGNGKKVDTAVMLIKYFRGRIEERRKELTETVNQQ